MAAGGLEPCTGTGIGGTGADASGTHAPSPSLAARAPPELTLPDPVLPSLLPSLMPPTPPRLLDLPGAAPLPPPARIAASSVESALTAVRSSAFCPAMALSLAPVSRRNATFSARSRCVSFRNL